jgi:uncharacterized protein (TIGR02001 family)
LGTNNFMYRGLSLSNNGAAIQGEVTVKGESGLYATLWGSNTTLRASDGSGSGLEGNFLVGFTNDITEDLSYDVGYMRTFYPGMNRGNPAAEKGGPRRDFNDFYGTLMYKGFSAGVSYSDDFFAETGSATYLFASYDAPIINDLSLIATVGYTRNPSKDFLGLFGVDKKGWAHYILGLSHPLPYDFEVSGAYHWTTGEVKRGFDVAGFGTNRFVVNLTKNF